jgi:hypothetical protein
MHFCLPDKEGAVVSLHFFLGGADLEMQTIRALLVATGATFTDDHLAWGARLSDYAARMEAAADAGATPVAIELSDDMPTDWPVRKTMLVIDHHGPLAGKDRPTSLEQVFNALPQPKPAFTRHMMLVAANDKGYLDGMKALGASKTEMIEIRRADRAAQGIRQADELEATRAIAAREALGRFCLIRTSSNTSSAIADGMSPLLGGPGHVGLVVLMPEKSAFFGSGNVVKALAEADAKSWWGGNLPDEGFWGASTQTTPHARLLQHLAPFAGD